MRSPIRFFLLGSTLALAGCDVYVPPPPPAPIPPPPPPNVVVTGPGPGPAVVVDAGPPGPPPAPYFEPVPPPPFVAAVWFPGHWVWGRHGWHWHHGYYH